MTRDPGPDDFGSEEAFESTAPAERPTRPGPAPEPTSRDILAAIEGVALGIARLEKRFDRLEASYEIMREVVKDHGTEIARLKERVRLLEESEALRG